MAAAASLVTALSSLRVISLLDAPTGRDERALEFALVRSRTAAMTVLFGFER